MLTVWVIVCAMAASLCLEPEWHLLQKGDRVSVKCRMIVWDQTGRQHLCRSVVHQQLFGVTGLVPNLAEFSFLDAQVINVEGRVHLDLNQGFALGLPVPRRSMYYECIEMCSGIGILGEGISSCGVSIKATNDVKEAMCQFQLRQGQCNVIQGDIGDASTLAGLHAAHPQPSMIAAGFSCQPWSQLGDNKKFDDLRAGSLHKVLQGAFWLGCHSLLLECVDEAGKDPDVQATLRQFCNATQFHAAQVHLRLESLMPTRRNRWWCLLMNPTIPKLCLRPLPALPEPPILSDFLPFFPEWDADTLAHLELDLYELNKFAEFNSLFNNLVNMKGQVRTALHGWANQLSGCPCGCRRFAFSEQRLREKGMFGALIPLGSELKTYLGVLPKVRHMHPYEMAFIHGAKPNRAWFPSLRFSICGLGQMASPVQSCWMVGQFLYHVLEGQCHTPEAFLWHHLQGVFAAVASEHPTLSQHPNVQNIIARLHLAMWHSAQANLGPAKPIGAQEESTTSHRMGREDPQNQKNDAQEILKQPGTGPQAPEKNTQQPGYRAREPDEKPRANQPGGESQKLNKKEALETLELPPPMVLQATPTVAPDPVGPSPLPQAQAPQPNESAKADPPTEDAGLEGCLPESPPSQGRKVGFGIGGGIDMNKNKGIQQTSTGEKTPQGWVEPRLKKARGDGSSQPEDGTARAMHAALFAGDPNQLRIHGTAGENPGISAHPDGKGLGAKSDLASSKPVLVPVSADGGIAAFVTHDITCGGTTPLSVKPDAGDIPSQELLQVVSETESGLRCPSHTVQVFCNDMLDPCPIQVAKDATVGSITVAEERLGTLQQPIAVYTCVGSAIKLSDLTSPYQQVFLKEFPTGECGVPGNVPSFFQRTDSCTRLQALWKQEAWVAVDEMNHYLHMISTANNVRVASAGSMPKFVEDEEIEQIIQDWFTLLMPPTDVATKAISALLVNGHWFPFVLTPAKGHVTIHTTAAGMSWAEIGIRKQGVEYTIIPVSFPLVTNVRNDCGFQTVAWLMDSLVAPDFGEPLYHVPPIETSTAVAWRQTFEHHLVTNALDTCQVRPDHFQLGGAESIGESGQGIINGLGCLVISLCCIFGQCCGGASVAHPSRIHQKINPHPAKCLSFLIWGFILAGTVAMSCMAYPCEPGHLAQAGAGQSNHSIISLDQQIAWGNVSFYQPQQVGQPSFVANRVFCFEPDVNLVNGEPSGVSNFIPWSKTCIDSDLQLCLPLDSEYPGSRFCTAVGTCEAQTISTETGSLYENHWNVGHACSQCADDVTGDAFSLMAMGKRDRLPADATPPVVDMPDVAHQADPEDDEDASDSDTSSVSDQNWQNTEIFTVVQRSVIRQLNIPHANLRRMQIASALNWATASVAGDFPLAFRPADMVDDQIRARLVRHVNDLHPQHTQQLILVDVEFHPPAPRHDFERIRMPIYALQFMTAIGFIRSMYLIPYCQYAHLPCFLWQNGVYWSLEDEALHQIHNGDYLRVVVPPPNPGHSECHPRALARALHLGFHPDSLGMVENLMDDDQVQAMPNPYRIILQADVVPDPMEDVQHLLQTSTQLHPPLSNGDQTHDFDEFLDTEIPKASSLPRMQATLGNNHACGDNASLGFVGCSDDFANDSELHHLLDLCTIMSRLPRLQATLGQHNACCDVGLGVSCVSRPEKMIGDTFTAEDTHDSALDSFLSVSRSVMQQCAPCPRMQATLGKHNACRNRLIRSPCESLDADKPDNFFMHGSESPATWTGSSPSVSGLLQVPNESLRQCPRMQNAQGHQHACLRTSGGVAMLPPGWLQRMPSVKVEDAPNHIVADSPCIKTRQCQPICTGDLLLHESGHQRKVPGISQSSVPCIIIHSQNCPFCPRMQATLGQHNACQTHSPEVLACLSIVVLDHWYPPQVAGTWIVIWLMLQFGIGSLQLTNLLPWRRLLSWNPTSFLKGGEISIKRLTVAS